MGPPRLMSTEKGRVRYASPHEPFPLGKLSYLDRPNRSCILAASIPRRVPTNLGIIGKYTSTYGVCIRTQVSLGLGS